MWEVGKNDHGFKTASSSGGKAKKEVMGALKSTIGASITRRDSSWSTASWIKHEVIHRITIRYATEFGLTIRGILKPDCGDDTREDITRQGPGPLRLARMAKRKAAAEAAHAGNKDTPIVLDDDVQEKSNQTRSKQPRM